MIMQMTIGTVMLVCMASASVAGDIGDRQGVRELVVPVGQIREVDVDYKMGFVCDDLSILRARMETRRHRYMPAALLDSQFAALEPPAGAIEIDVALTPEECLTAILARLAPPRAGR